MKKPLMLALFVLVIAGLFGASKVWQQVAPPVLSFTQQCLKDGNMWHEMTPLKNGVQLEGDAQPGCMIANALHHFSDEVAYAQAKDPGESDIVFDGGQPRAGVPALLQIAIRESDGSVPELFREHEKYVHVIVISKDMTFFRHVHPEDQSDFSDERVATGDFDMPFTFPRAGEYIVAIDYANQLKHESRQFRVHVGGPEEQKEAPTYKSPAEFNGYDVDFEYDPPRDGVTTLRYTVRRDGEKLTDLQPYLGAAMHVAIVKNDLSEFIHTHGEVHQLGATPSAPMIGHQHTPPPEKFGPMVEAHAVFPSTGLYTVFGEFKRNGAVVPTVFSVRIE